MSKIGLVWRTIRHLTIRQIVYQVINRLSSRPRLNLAKCVPKTYFLTAPKPDKPVAWTNNSFIFLNQYVDFLHQIDWNYAGYGKLWTYNLNYFDFLNQPNVTPEEGLRLIRDFINQTDRLRDGLEPYPTSLRMMNWVQFLSRFQIQDGLINSHLFAQTQLLSRRLEYHLAGNHLLENGFALLFAALYFRDKRWYRKASALIRNELSTQILADGGHDERSPMYHQILADRLLTVLLALQHDTWQNDKSLITFLNQKATQMLGWLNAITFHNGDVPMVNDAACGIALTTTQLRENAELIGISAWATKPVSKSEAVTLKQTESGYRMFRQNRFELFVDAGEVGPDHQPGHAHADTFSFVLYVDNLPFIVDSGTSTYQIGKQRQWERSTAAHNTVEVNGTDSSEVWAGFRVGSRARVNLITDSATVLMAQHNGYKRFGIIHERSWIVGPTKLTVIDRLLNVKNKTLSGQNGIARFHIHPDLTVQLVGESVVLGPIQLSFLSVTKLELLVTTYAMADEFNQLRSGQCVEIAFTDTLTTTLTLLNEDTLPNL